MYFPCDEISNSFDQFLLWISSRYAENSSYLHILSGASISDQLKNYILILQECPPKLTIAEYRISIEDYRHASPSRGTDLERLVRGLPNQVEEGEALDVKLAKRYLLLGNESTGSISDSEDNVEIVKGFASLGQWVPELLPLVRVARVDADLGWCENVFQLKIGEGSRSVKQLLLERCDAIAEEAFPKYYPIDPVIKNGMSLMELYDDIKYKQLDLGVFLIREATSHDLITHIDPIRCLEDLTPSSYFVASDSVSFDELRQLYPLVHEVVFRQEYCLVYWHRSSGGTSMLRKYLTCAATEEYDRCPPPRHWVNVIHGAQTVGKSTFLRRLERKFRRNNPFGIIRMIDGIELEPVIGNEALSTVQKLAKLFRMESKIGVKIVEALAKRKDDILVLIDDAEQIGGLLFQFLQEVERDLGTAVIFWIAAKDRLRNQIEDRFPIVAHEFSELDKVQQVDYLEQFLPKLSLAKIEETLKFARSCNLHLPFHDTCVEYPITKNVFYLKLIADMVKHAGSLYLPDMFDYFIENNLKDIADLEVKCYKVVIDGDSDPTITQNCKYSTIVEYLAARYLSKHVDLINLTLYRDYTTVANFLDQLLVRHDKFATAILNRDTEQVLIELESYQESLDSLNRNALHLARDCPTIQEALVAVGLNLEQRCLLSNYTPLQMADERHDWRFVNLLLRNNANSDFTSLRLRTMPPDQLEDVLETCISYTLTFHLDWILTNRLDYRITQRIIYNACVCSDTLGQDLILAILDRAHEQNLNDPPYRFMWGSTALHMAAYSGSLTVCRFLVERLGFNADLQDYSGQKAVDEAGDVEVVSYLRSLSMNVVEDIEEDPEDSSDDIVDDAFVRACNSGNLDMVRYCVERDDLKPERLRRGFFAAIAWGYLPIVEYLYDNGFRDQLEEEDSTGYTALSSAVRFEKLDIIKFLADRGADTSKILDAPNSTDVRRYLEDCCQYKTSITFEYLSGLGCDELRALDYDFSTENEDGQVFLHYYIEYHDNSKILSFLLTKYQDINLVCKFTGRTPLLEALNSNKSQFVEILLQSGADVTRTCTKTGQSALHFAANHNDKPLLDLFLTKYGLPIDSRDHKGHTIAFNLVANCTQINLFRYLADRYGLDVNARNAEGRTVLHEKIISGGFFHLHEVEYLLRDAGVRQSVADGRGRLALHYAAEGGSVKVVRLLKRYGNGLEWNVRDRDGKSPVDLAKEAGQFEKLLTFFEMNSRE